jgi:peptidyl-prolyl cis-trans isomerase A (cyclophilin A)
MSNSVPSGLTALDGSLVSVENAALTINTTGDRFMKRWIGSIAVASLALSLACGGEETQQASTDGTAETAGAATDCSVGTSNTVVIATNMGDITIELFPEQAPITVENFLGYVQSCFYDGTIFHRVVPGFVLQGGGVTVEGQPKQTRDPITNEADNGLLNERGTLSMARRADVNSATSQFFINLDDNTILDHGVRDFGYAVFARVTDGMDVVDRIAQVRTRNERPEEPVVILSARRQ